MEPIEFGHPHANDLSPDETAQVNAISEQLRAEALALVRKSNIYLVFAASRVSDETAHAEKVIAVVSDNRELVVEFYIDAVHTMVEELASVLETDNRDAAAWLIAEVFTTHVLQDL